MIRLSARIASALALVALSFPVFVAAAQQDAPAAPAQEPSAAPAREQSAPAQPAQAPSAPAPAEAPVFPKPDPANFTASSPTKETVNAFLQASWGFDEDRVWQVQAILKSQAEGVSRVVVMVGDKSGKQKPGELQFFVLSDGKHIIAGSDMIPFGEHPYEEYRAEVEKSADGPYRSSALKNFEIVEFADFQCPHCKEAQANMDKLAVDFPKARFVFENYPLPQHSAAAGAAAYGVCVAKQGGSDAFFTFAAAVFDGQDGLASSDGATLTLNSAVAKAGLEPAKIAACASAPETVENVEASKKLAEDLGVNETPMLVVNGRLVPAGAPYETLKKIILYQAKLDGVTIQ